LRGRRLGDLHRGRLGDLHTTEPPVVFIQVVLPVIEAPIWRGFALSHTMMLTARRTISHVTSRPVEAQRLRDLKLLRRVRDRMDREYAQPLDVEALARGVNMSAGHLSRQFRLAYGESPYSYLMTRRIERAMALLRRGDLSVTEVCFAVGCASLGTFSTRFTELVGMPPSAYREQTAGMTEGIPSCVEKQVTRPIRNREAPIAELHLA
jgi:AraC-like DNA-binding protein